MFLKIAASIKKPVSGFSTRHEQDTKRAYHAADLCVCFQYAKSSFSNDAAHVILTETLKIQTRNENLAG